MSYKALYRTYRPQKFSEVVGQEAIVRTLQNAIGSGKISHAYLFTGPRGTGKTTVARILAKALNCGNKQGAEPCGKCLVCQEIATSSSPDVVEIDAASNNGVDEIRDIREKVKFLPSGAKYKVYIIDEVHMLTNEAFNALLKVLEEPPRHVVFVFATTEPHKIPATVASRCQRFDFRRLSMAETVARLAAVAAAEGIDATEEALRVIARYAEGSLRDGLGLLDQCRAYAARITPEIVTGVLGVAPREQVMAFADVLAAGDAARGLALVRDLQEAGRDLRQFLRDAARYLRDVLLYKVAGEQALGAALPPDSEEAEALRRQAAALPVPLLLRAIETLGAAEADMRYAAQSQLPLEMAIVRLTRPEVQLDPEQLLLRIERLEQQVAALAGQGPAPVPAGTGAAEGAADRAPIPTAPAGPRPQPGQAGGQEPREEPEDREAAGRPPAAGPAPRAADTGSARDTAPAPGEEPAAADDLARVVAQWDRVLQLLKDQRQLAVQAFLREGRPVACRGGVVTIEFPPDRSFHRDNLQADQNRKVVEQILSRLLGRKVRVTTVLAGQQPAEEPGAAPGGAAPQAPDDAVSGAPREAPGGAIQEHPAAASAPQAPLAGSGDDADDVINSPAVQEALRLFGGRVIHVQRDRR